MIDAHPVWLRILADHGDVNESQKERLYEAADRIEQLEMVLGDLVFWLDRTDRQGCAHTEHARRVLDGPKGDSE